MKRRTKLRGNFANPNDIVGTMDTLPPPSPAITKLEQTPWVRVVIVNYNAGDLLAKTIDALALQTMADFEAVIIDNASSDKSIDNLHLPDSRFQVLSAGGNLGFAAGCNLGARDSATPWLAMLNPDAVPAADWLAALQTATQNNPLAAVFGSTQLMADCPSILDGAGDNYSIFGIAWRGGYGASADLIKNDILVFSPCAAAALYRRDVFETVGGFAEGFFCYLEDVDLGFRLRLAGHMTLQVAAARVMHAGSAIAGRHSPFTLYHSARNGIYLILRCMPLPLLALTLPLYLAAQVWLMMRMGGRSAAWSRIRGVIHGLRAVPHLLAQRHRIQHNRHISIRDIATLLVWDPRKLSRRRIVPLD